MWDAETYAKFLNERNQPSMDLIQKIELPREAQIIDLGCGLGNSTALLHQTFPEATILGVDASIDMLKKARIDYPHLKFEQLVIPDDLEENNEYDLVFANALLQWIPEHEQLLKRLIELLCEKGILAVQIPLQKDSVFHQILSKLVREERWRNWCSKVPAFHTHSISEYYDMLSVYSKNIQIWTTTYIHVLEDAEEILEWYRGTSLKPYLEAVDDPVQFKKELLQEIIKAYPKQKDGSILFPFPRLFFIIEK